MALLRRLAPAFSTAGFGFAKTVTLLYRMCRFQPMTPSPRESAESEHPTTKLQRPVTTPLQPTT